MPTQRPTLPQTAAIAGGIWILIDCLRGWSPSLITIFGRAAETPAELMGLYALGCVAVSLIPLFVFRKVRGAGPLMGAMLLLVVLRLAGQFTDGDKPQLYVYSAAAAVGITWLGLAAQRFGTSLVTGFASGIALSTITHAGLGTWGAVWRDGAWGWGATLLAVTLTVAAHSAARRAEAAPAGRRTAVMLLPTLLICGILFANAGRASAVAGTTGLVLASLGAVLGVAATLVAATRRTTLVAAAVAVICAVDGLLVTMTVDGVPHVSPAWAAFVFLLGTPAMLHLLAAAPTARPTTGLAVAGGGIVWVLLFFAYYAGYDLGYRADLLLVVVVVALAGAALWGAPATVASTVPWRWLAGAGVVAVIVALFGPGLTIRPIDKPAAQSPSVLAAYNLRMGYGIDGRFNPADVAEILKVADVALLSEVDRGWLLNGGQDELAILTRMLGGHAVFAPAADPVWGDAIWSREPITGTHGHAFDSYGAVTGAQALTGRTTLPDGSRITVVSTHLQPLGDGTDDTLEQATDLAGLLAKLDGPVIAGGDLNTTVGSAAWKALLGSGLTPATNDVGPTSPADAPSEQIDHLLTTGVSVTRAGVVRSLASDHLPVFVAFSLD